MQDIGASREELREVVSAGLRAQTKESAEMQKRLCEEIGIPYSPQDETQEQILNSLIVDPCTDYLMGAISEEEFWVRLNQVVREYALAQMPKEANEKEKLKIGRMVDATMNSMRDFLILALLPAGDIQERNIQYYQCVFRIARERGILPAQVITNVELRREVVRNVMTREECQARVKKFLPFLDLDKLLDMILKPAFVALANELEDGEDPEEIYNEFKEETLQDAAFQQQMSGLKDAAVRILEEETNKIYGQPKGI